MLTPGVRSKRGAVHVGITGIATNQRGQFARRARQDLVRAIGAPLRPWPSCSTAAGMSIDAAMKKGAAKGSTGICDLPHDLYAFLGTSVRVVQQKVGNVYVIYLAETFAVVEAMRTGRTATVRRCARGTLWAMPIERNRGMSDFDFNSPECQVFASRD